MRASVVSAPAFALAASLLAGTAFAGDPPKAVPETTQDLGPPWEGLCHRPAGRNSLGWGYQKNVGPPYIDWCSDQQIWKPGQFGMLDTPDEHLGIFWRPGVAGYDYELYVAGTYGGTVLMGSSHDFQSINPIPLNPKDPLPATAQAVLKPTCRNNAGECPLVPCGRCFDAGYAGTNSVFQVGNELYLVYSADTSTFEDKQHNWRTFSKKTDELKFYGSVGLANVSVGTNHFNWRRSTPIVTGEKLSYEDVEAAPQVVFGLTAPSAIMANDTTVSPPLPYLYVFYTYHPLQTHGGSVPSHIEVARALVDAGLKTTHFDVLAGGAWSATAKAGEGDAIIPSSAGQDQPWVGWAGTDNGGYLLVYVDGAGWWSSTSQDLIKWRNPTKLLDLTGLTYTPMFYAVLASPDAQYGVGVPSWTIGNTGYVLYAAKKTENAPHELHRAAFRFGAQPCQEVADCALPRCRTGYCPHPACVANQCQTVCNKDCR
jgi:hypothetical protein